MPEYIEKGKLMDAFRKYMAERFDSKKCISEESCKACESGCLWRKVVENVPVVNFE